MNILVTGGAGYIGSFMTKKLLDNGNGVFVFDNLSRGHKEAIDQRATFINGDLLDEVALDNIFSKTTIDAVVHFAAYISMEESMEKPGDYFRNNTFGTLKLLEAMAKFHVKNIIFSSTAGVYGNPTTELISEEHQKNPENPYGESKLVVEQILAWYQKIYNINSISLRYFNAAGGAIDGSRGENHPVETHLIPNLILSALQDKVFTLYGIDYPTSDGTCVRDYIHILDLVIAHILAFEKLLKGSEGNIAYNVGTGNGYSNKQVIDVVEKVSGKKCKVQIAPRRPGDAAILVANVEKIKRELGFTPIHSDLETIVRSAWLWHKSQYEQQK